MKKYNKNIMQTILKDQVEKMTEGIKQSMMDCNRLMMEDKHFGEFENIFVSYDNMKYFVGSSNEDYNPYYLYEVTINLKNNYSIHFSFNEQKEQK